MSGAYKKDEDKARFHLIPPESIKGVADVLTFGAKKYGERNWEKGLDSSRIFSAAQRHLWAWWSGEENDHESGLSHLHHAAANVMMLQTVGSGFKRLVDNRPEADPQMSFDFNQPQK